MPDSNIIQIDQNLFETKLDRLVTEKMTQILNAMLDAEADEITGAAGYERKEGRKAYRAGHYERTLTAKAGRLELRVPKLKGAVFESAVIERYRRRESSVEEALMEMYLAGVSTRQVDDISANCCGVTGCHPRPFPTSSSACMTTSTDGAPGHWNPNTRTCSWTACGTSAPGAEAWRTSASSSPSASTRRATARSSA